MTSSVGIELLSSSARVTSVKSANSLGVRESGPIDRTPGTPGSDKKEKKEKKTHKGKRTKRQKYNRHIPKRVFDIVTSGQFRTLAMFLSNDNLVSGLIDLSWQNNDSIESRSF